MNKEAAAPDLLAENERMWEMCEELVDALYEVNEAFHLGSVGEEIARDASEIVLAKWEKMKESFNE